MYVEIYITKFLPWPFRPLEQCFPFYWCLRRVCRQIYVYRLIKQTPLLNETDHIITETWTFITLGLSHITERPERKTKEKSMLTWSHL